MTYNNKYQGLTIVNYSTEARFEKTILVFGAGRGGTSAISGCLRELGVQMPSAHPLKHEWAPIPENIKDNQLEVENIIDEFNKRYPIWGWKNPRDVFRCSELLPKLRNPHVIIVFRNPIEVSKSINKYDDLPIEIGLSETILVYQEISRFLLSPVYPAAVVSYEEMISSGASVVNSLNKWLNITKDESLISRAVDFISKGNHYKSISGGEKKLFFSESELLLDRKGSWISQYPKHISLLAQSCAAVERSIISATEQVDHLKDSLYELCKNRGNQIGLKIDQSVIYEMHDIDYNDFCNIFRIEKREAVESSLDSPEKTGDYTIDLSPITDETYAHILPTSYEKLKLRLRNVSDQRQNLQLRMDDISKKRDALYGLLISGAD